MIGEMSFWVGVASVLIGSGLMDLWRMWRRNSPTAQEKREKGTEAAQFACALMDAVYDPEGTVAVLEKIAKNETPGANATVRRMALLASTERARLDFLLRDVAKAWKQGGDGSVVVTEARE